jgi:dTDP-4-amino-4,6-dideoxygalactose transaminase
MKIAFSPPDITESEIAEVVDTLRSGWITTGPKTKLFEKEIAGYCGTKKAVCLGSATAALELILRYLGIGPGDEVITPAYTYTASASVIAHVGAKIVLCDVAKDSYFMDKEKLATLITPRTKAIIAVDIAGILCDYEALINLAESKKNIFIKDERKISELGRIAIIADAAHSFGATRFDGIKSGMLADFTAFSFHAVKNLTTAEGGALTWREGLPYDSGEIYKQFMLYSLHGQNKDAFTKTNGSWEYDIVAPLYKCNMTDIHASIGLSQLRRYDEMLNARKKIYEHYLALFSENDKIEILKHKNSSYHLMLTRIRGITEKQRNEIFTKMLELGVNCNVHYKPLPMMTAYKNFGFNIKDYPNSYNQYINELTLPLHSKLTEQEIDYIGDCLNKILKSN